MDHHGTAALEVAVGFCPAEPSQNPAANLQVPKYPQMICEWCCVIWFFLCLALIIVASAIYSVCVCEPTCLPMIFLEEVHTWWLQTESQSNSHRLCIPTWKGEGRSAALNHLNSGEKIAPGGFSLLWGCSSSYIIYNHSYSYGGAISQLPDVITQVYPSYSHL
jgi:hypothetical protein